MPKQPQEARSAAQDQVIRWQSYLSGPRWAFGVDTIYDLAIPLGLSVESVSEHKGWLTKTVTFAVRGERRRVLAMQRLGAKAVREWNG